MSVGLAIMCMAKYEAIPLLIAFGVLVAFQTRRGARIIDSLLLLALPVFSLVYFFGASHVIVGDAFYFYGAMKNNASGGSTQWWMPRDGTASLLSDLKYALSITAWTSIALVVCLGLLARLAICRSGPDRRRAVVVATGTLFLVGISGAAQVWAMKGGNSFGNPRYFVPAGLGAYLLGTFLLIPAAPKQGHLQRPVGASPLLLGAVALTLVASSVGQAFFFLSRPGAIEREDVPIHYLIPIDLHQDSHLRKIGSSDPHFDTRDWREAAKKIDTMLKPGDLVAVQSGNSFGVVLGTAHPQRYLVDSDRDYEQILSLKPVPVNYLFRSNATSDLRFGGLFESAFRDPGDGQWEAVLELSVGTLYHRAIDPKTAISNR
jgi:hypothetical protein